MPTAERVLAIAAKEIGTASGAKYWRSVYPKTAYVNGSKTPYCACFVSWVMAQAGQKVPGLPGGYCPSIWNAAKRAKATKAVANAKPGDVVLFDWGPDGMCDHIGLVERNDNTKRFIQTIEGNTNGGKVARRTRAYSTVVGVIRPDYEKYPMKGIDVYSDDGWPFTGSVKKAYKDSDFVIVKATQGKTYKNPEFDRQCKGVVRDSKLLGVFHYAGRAKDGKTDPVHEADAFWSYASKYKGKAVPCLDWEAKDNPNWGDKTWCMKFAKRTKELWGTWPMVYVQASAIAQVATCYPNCPLWVAGYPTDADSWEVPSFRYSTKPWEEFAMWQFTSGHEKCDRNVSTLTPTEWRSMYTGQKPQKHTSTEKLEVDGWWGVRTTRALQKQMKTSQDGIISGQYTTDMKWMTRGDADSWQWNNGRGSAVIRAMQKKLGVKADGWYGKNTSAALRKHLGVKYTADSHKRDTEIVKHLQRNLNQGRF